MTKVKKRIPTKLKNDAVVEAILELRFETAILPEVLFGRLTDYSPWKGFEQKKLPAYDIPATIRDSDAKLRYLPIFELKDTKQNRLVHIGARVLAYHRLTPYIGWNDFKSELEEVVDGLFSTAGDINIRRLGFRYMNAIVPELHNINSIIDLDLNVSVEDENISQNVNINFKDVLPNKSEYTVRVATSEFIQGAVPKNTSVFVDVDVYTQENFRTKDTKQVKDWIEFAHNMEKEQFFRLLTQDSIDAMEEK